MNMSMHENKMLRLESKITLSPSRHQVNDTTMSRLHAYSCGIINNFESTYNIIDTFELEYQMHEPSQNRPI
jgi:hypothetical protein